MDKELIETLREMYEQDYRMIDSSAEVVVELGEVDYATNPTIKEYQRKGYKLVDANGFGEGARQCGEFLVFIRIRE